MSRFITLLIIVLPFLCNCQEKKNYLSIEGGGVGLVASANVGRTIFTHERFKVISQIGLGWTPKTAHSDWPFNVPFQLTCNFGNRDFFFEAGFGTTLVFKSMLDYPNSENYCTGLYASPVFGFRHEGEKVFTRFYGCLPISLSSQHLSDDVTADFIKFGIAIGTRFK
ncbi:hypothetical protein SLH46_20545 [Draconibacterium sp. IB214405]|uniref:hypothetical protein n=1 Tax=Draconibacterium sp. IB214405 TaxID=3097352 RepID=UPI002A0CC387|nr:hypothetical protein [Draconibacterium sp. IB214405]MDX8341600.1 hypothetical protein [Draconibacterium sp. IB214405]